MLLEIDWPCCPLVKRLQQIPFLNLMLALSLISLSPQPLYLLCTNTSVSVGELQLYAYSQRASTSLFLTCVATQTVAQTIQALLFLYVCILQLTSSFIKEYHCAMLLAPRIQNTPLYLGSPCPNVGLFKLS